MKPIKALDIVFSSDAGDDLTIRDYFRVLLSTLWDEKEGFSGKRPFGNSGWEYDLYKPLIEAGAIPGKLDEDGYVEAVDRAVAHTYIADLICLAFYGEENENHQALCRDHDGNT